MSAIRFLNQKILFDAAGGIAFADECCCDDCPQCYSQATCVVSGIGVATANPICADTDYSAANGTYVAGFGDPPASLVNCDYGAFITPNIVIPAGPTSNATCSTILTGVIVNAEPHPTLPDTIIVRFQFTQAGNNGLGSFTEQVLPCPGPPLVVVLPYNDGFSSPGQVQVTFG